MKNIILGVLAVGVLGGGAYYFLGKSIPAVDPSKVAQIITGENTSNTSSTGSEDTQYILTPGQKIVWLGRKPGGQHTGTIDIIDGFMNFAEEKIQGAEVNFAVDTLTVSDLQGGAAEKLANHLAQGFFNTKEFPTGKFVFEMTVMSGSEMRGQGSLTLKGKTNRISFPLMIEDKGSTVTMKSDFFIDRTQWGITEMVGAVDNFVGISFDLTWTKK